MLEAEAWFAKYNKPVLMTEYGADTLAGLHVVSFSFEFLKNIKQINRSVTHSVFVQNFSIQRVCGQKNTKSYS